MVRPTEKDIVLLDSGFYHLPCDGRHPHNHKYLYYTKKEVLRLWREEHPRKESK
jgi:hypothetical protein